uniref:Metalloendopeptidase n=1 Tax=Denticeps clupeoides TaxID=299321 RepID=A0AAY4D9V6_9TELE
HFHSLVQVPAEDSDESGNAEVFSASNVIERANRNLGRMIGGPRIMFGDVAVEGGFQSGVPCTSRDCLWPKSKNGKVYVPVVVSKKFSSRETEAIRCALDSFHSKTCVRFMKRSSERDYIDITPKEGCWSYIGRTTGRQELSLQRGACLHRPTIQHELLHALGFHHEHSRSDRDNHVHVLYRNIMPGAEGQFQKVRTNNQVSPYDYSSVMHYGRADFSRNGEPTIIPVHDGSIPIGRATQMSLSDVLRVNRLYCQVLCSVASRRPGIRTGNLLITCLNTVV